MAEPRIPIPLEAIADFCRRHHIKRLSLFGSVLRDYFGPDSDVDFLVDLEPGRTLLDHGQLQADLEELLGCRVDVVTDRGLLRSHIRARVLEEAVPL